MRFATGTLFIIAAVSLLQACSDPATNCGKGALRDVDGETYCLYQQNLIIEGFECPNSMTPHNIEGGVVCSPQDGPLPQDLEDSFNPTTPWCIDNCNVIDEPNTWPAPKPASSDDFKKIYRHKDYACVVDKGDIAQCWGPAVEDTNGDLFGTPTTLQNVKSMTTVGANMCVLYTDDSVDCFVKNGTKLTLNFNSASQPSTLTASTNTLCGLSANALICSELGAQKEALHDFLKQAMIIGVEFNQFAIKTQQSDQNIVVCGVGIDQNVQCWTNNGSNYDKQGTFKDVRVYQDDVACGLLNTNKLQCWDAKDGKDIAAPTQSFIELYGALCGLQVDNKVVCWTNIRDNTNTIELLDEHPLSFDLVYDSATPRDTSWCAITTDGNIRCAAFRKKL